MRSARSIGLAVALLTGCAGDRTDVAPSGAPDTDGGAPSVTPAADSGAQPSPSFVSSDGGTVPTADAGNRCPSPLPPADPNLVTMSPTFASTYSAYALGPLPGIAPSRLGGTIVSPSDPNVLWVATDSEASSGAIAQVRVKRDACGHIVGFDGDASVVATTPYVDANLLLGPSNVLFYSQWPVNKLSEIPLSSGWTTTYTADLTPVGIASGSPGGIGFVPPYLQDPAGLRAVAWPSGDWYHVTYAANGSNFDIAAVHKTVTLANGPGGFAYVPKDSPGFAKPSLITCEWAGDKVVVYEVDDQGDPVVATRNEFFTKFPKPWGAYFEPQTGDYLFLTWGAASGSDALYVVQGFTRPPPPPPAPPPPR